MCIKEFVDYIDSLPIKQDYIVKLCYGYSKDDMEECNVLLCLDGDLNYYWLNDWYEGQEFVEVKGFIPIQDVDFSNV